MKQCKSKHHSRLFAALSLVAFVCGTSGDVIAQSSAQSRAKAAAIAKAAGNGIHVEKAKVYDDTALQLMLNAAKSRLAALQSLDQAALTTRIGAVTGASLQQQAFSAQILGPTIPGSTVTDLGGTGSTQTVNAPVGQTTTANAGQPIQNITTNNPQLTPSASGLPTLSTALPSSGFSISSLDVLGEMMQLTFEIANLQLLLDGSLTDRFVEGTSFVKPRTTLGFSISITTQKRFKDAVAVVEVETYPPPEVLGQEAPGLIALLPREKTYNVASITDNMSQIGGGIVSQVISGGASFLRGRKTYYLVQDQDTLATVLPSSEKRATAFSWQFRPVLGRQYVKSGLKQTFAQITMPITEKATTFGKVKVRTYWQKFDRKLGVLKDVIPESIDELDVPYNIPRYNASPKIQKVETQEVGSGVLHTTVEGNFMTGTYVRVGGNFYRDGSPGFSSDLKQIRFTASAADIARHGAYFVNRDGTQTRIEGPLEPCRTSRPTAAHSISAYDGANSILRLEVKGLDPCSTNDLADYVMLINGKVFGLSDAPIERRRETTTNIVLRAIVPNALLFTSSDVEVVPLFWKAEFEIKSDGLKIDLESTQDKIVPLGKLSDGRTRFLLYGSRLIGATIIQPRGITLTKPLQTSDDVTLRAFDLTPEQEKGLKAIVLVKSGDGRPIFVPMPASAAKPSVTSTTRMSVGTEELIVTSEFFDRLKGIKFRGVDLLDGFVRERNNITLTNLNKKGLTATPGIKKLEFDFGDGEKIVWEIEVVSGRIELVLPG